ncbi:hypothetical protein B1M_07000 [Burkholderia sp. TJI49]|nr:hypothetical protein B1M_07000 [Burkholderia sp. TJI49]
MPDAGGIVSSAAGRASVSMRGLFILEARAASGRFRAMLSVKCEFA